MNLFVCVVVTKQVSWLSRNSEYLLAENEFLVRGKWNLSAQKTDIAKFSTFWYKKG